MRWKPNANNVQNIYLNLTGASKVDSPSKGYELTLSEIFTVVCTVFKTDTPSPFIKITTESFFYNFAFN